jgi:predicted metalloprotease with PDZ domain
VAQSLGLTLADLSAAQKKELDLKEGVRVVSAEGPAARAGLREGDVIVAVANTEVSGVKEFEAAVAKLDKSRPVNVLFRRGEWDRARFYLRRVHAQPDQASPPSLWLAARVEHRSGNPGARDRLGQELLRRFPQSREALLWEKGRFDE